MCGFVDYKQVVINLVKIIDGIKQINPKAKIYFLTISDDYDIVKEYAKYQCAYLSNDYFKGFNFKFPENLWADYYTLFIEDVKKRVDVIPMITDSEFLHKYLSDDNIHPNEKGHEIIAENIKQYI